jgi:hypothetical protein
MFLCRYSWPYRLKISATSGDLLCSFISSLLLLVHQIEWTFELDVAGWNEVQIDRGRFYGSMAKQLADRIEIAALIEQVGGEAVTQGVEAACFG